MAEYSVLTTSEYHLFQIYDAEVGPADENQESEKSQRKSTDGVVSSYGNRTIELVQAEETFKVKFELRAWKFKPSDPASNSGGNFQFHIAVPSKKLVLDSVARGTQALWELPIGGELHGNVCYVGREEACSLAEALWDELGEDYSIEEKQRMARPHEGTEKYLIDIWPATTGPHS
ncbi:hypothetical protein [Nocardiopsis sp. FR6]|uniref:hypothetical protein n=1 Tax=Nocardiopsis sp. FR6 TaxID=2605986 RepID=UPI0013572FC1|nr:hypothetical protein [Nocardiopsis sp. FR6]